MSPSHHHQAPPAVRQRGEQRERWRAARPVELLLDRQRPEVLDRRGRPALRQQVLVEPCRPRNTQFATWNSAPSTSRAQRGRRRRTVGEFGETTTIAGKADHARGQQAPEPAGVERRRDRCPPARRAPDEQRGDQEAREGEEHRHAEVATGEAGTPPWNSSTARTASARTPSSAGWYAIVGRTAQKCTAAVIAAHVRSGGTFGPMRGASSGCAADGGRHGCRSGRRRAPVQATQPAHGDTVVARTTATCGPFGPITVFGDSVLLGRLGRPTFTDRRAEWGGARSGAGPRGEQLDRLVVTSGETRPRTGSIWRPQGWDPPNVWCTSGPTTRHLRQRADCASGRSCTSSTRSGRAPIWWPKITHPVPATPRPGTWLDPEPDERGDFSRGTGPR